PLGSGNLVDVERLAGRRGDLGRGTLAPAWPASWRALGRVPPWARGGPGRRRAPGGPPRRSRPRDPGPGLAGELARPGALGGATLGSGRTWSTSSAWRAAAAISAEGPWPRPGRRVPPSPRTPLPHRQP